MYKIYINQTPLIICHSEKISDLKISREKVRIVKFNGRKKSLMPYIDSLEKPHQLEAVIIHSEDPKACFKIFKSLYQTIKAAGGVVKRKPKKKKVLFIYRLGYYDLPKGKIEKEEKTKQAAIREVQEETGLKKIKLKKKIGKTYHTYKDKHNKRILKKTVWYRMTTKQKKVEPQEEEGIEYVFWMRPKDFLGVKRNTYGNILDVLAAL